MRISVINLTRGLLADRDVITAIRAINRQINEDFAPYWNMRGELRLEGATASRPDPENPEDMQGEAILYLWDKSDIPDALGYHEMNYKGIPYGMVFVDIATEIGENWTVTFSHEVLELLGDRQANRLIRGPDPRDRRRNVFHWHEMCDAVQDESYEIDGVEVSNFVLPLYFTEDTEPGSRNDFLGTRYAPTRRNPQGILTSFGINPGGYIGFYDPETGAHVTEMGPDAVEGNHASGTETWARATFRRQRKNKARMARRGNRYSGMGDADVVDPQKLPRNKDSRITINQRQLTIRCATHALSVTPGIPPLADEAHQTRGYFAHNIYASAESFAQGLIAEGFEEIAALQIDPVAKVNAAARPTAEIEIAQGAQEAVMAIVDIDGVLFWKQPARTSKGRAIFDLRVPTVEKNARSRRGFQLTGSTTIVRFIRQKITQKARVWLTTHLAQFLATTIEQQGFRKPASARLFEARVLANPLNNKIGEFVEYKGTLEGNRKYLLLIHGIFSSVQGAFGELLLSRNYDNLLRRVHDAGNYHGILGFDHWTVARSTLENAAELLALLPEACSIDIVCHSRGAGVTRCLLEHPDLHPRLVANGIRVRKVIFVAGACQGSELADPQNIHHLVNTFAAFSSVANAYLPLTLFTGLLKAVQYGVKHFPGIASMAPDSPLLRQLNQPLNALGCEYVYSRSNFEPSGKLLEMLDHAGIDKFIFKGKKNDGVVPFDGAGTFDDHVVNTIPVRRGPQFGVSGDQDVFHTDFFIQREVRDLLLQHLGG